jgi:hypothetical protein
MKIPASWSNVEDMVKGFAKAALKHWLKHATRADLANPQIYESVRLTLARNFRSTWKIRQVTGELMLVLHSPWIAFSIGLSKLSLLNL